LKDTFKREEIGLQVLVLFFGKRLTQCVARRYCELYDLSPEMVKPGLSFRDLLLRKQTGSLAEDVDDVFKRITESLKEQKALSVIRPAKNGGFVRIASEPHQDRSLIRCRCARGQ
jgi:PAS fold